MLNYEFFVVGRSNELGCIEAVVDCVELAIDIDCDGADGSDEFVENQMSHENSSCAETDEFWVWQDDCFCSSVDDFATFDNFTCEFELFSAITGDFQRLFLWNAKNVLRKILV